MKLTEAHFKFPIRMFDPHSAAKAEKSFHSEFVSKDKIEYVIGTASIPYEQITHASWHDSYMPHREVENVKEHGCDSTMVYTPTMGSYMCAWKLPKFEQELNAYIERIEKQTLAEFPPPPPQKLSRWARFKSVFHGK